MAVGFVMSFAPYVFGEVGADLYEGIIWPEVVLDHPVPPDTTPPEVENFYPVGTFKSDTVFEFDIPGVLAIVFVTVYIGNAAVAPRRAETIWDGEDFADTYKAAASEVVVDVNVNTHFAIKRLGGWPMLPLEFVIKSCDRTGNVS
jgi:hypothetical protein